MMARKKIVSLTERRIKQIKAERLPPDKYGYRWPTDAARKLMAPSEILHELEMGTRFGLTVMRRGGGGV